MSNKSRKNKSISKKKEQLGESSNIHDNNFSIHEEICIKTEQADSNDSYIEEPNSFSSEAVIKTELYSSSDDDDDYTDLKLRRVNQKIEKQKFRLKHAKSMTEALKKLEAVQKETFELNKKYYQMKLQFLKEQNDILDERCQLLNKLADKNY